MLSLYEILKASKTGIAPDMWTALAGANFGGSPTPTEHEYTGAVPYTFNANGSTTVDVETTLKPSEVYIKYKGV